MTDNIQAFLKLEIIQSLSNTDRLVAAVWWHQHNDDHVAVFSEIVDQYEKAGYPPINRNREREKLKKDRRTTSSDKGKTFKIQIRAAKELDDIYSELLTNRPLPKSSTIFDIHDFQNTRGYIINVIQQINVSYDIGLHDCCAVMIRRLLETLIIEIYENLDRAGEIKNSDGHFMMFSGLLSFIENDEKVNIGRQTTKGLKGFKRIADSSAHNRRYNATKKAIDDEIDGVKIAVVELKQFAFS